MRQMQEMTPAQAEAYVEHVNRMNLELSFAVAFGNILPNIAALRSASHSAKVRMHKRWLKKQHDIATALTEAKNG